MNQSKESKESQEKKVRKEKKEKKDDQKDEVKGADLIIEFTAPVSEDRNWGFLYVADTVTSVTPESNASKQKLTEGHKMKQIGDCLLAIEKVDERNNKIEQEINKFKDKDMDIVFLTPRPQRADAWEKTADNLGKEYHYNIVTQKATFCSTKDFTEARQTELKIKFTKNDKTRFKFFGDKVTKVPLGSDAERKGLKRGSRIIEINGKSLQSLLDPKNPKQKYLYTHEDIHNELEKKMEEGKGVVITFFKKQIAPLKGERKVKDKAKKIIITFSNEDVNNPKMERQPWGFSNQGNLVKNVDEKGYAYAQGLRYGYLIWKVDDHPVPNNAAEIRDRILSRRQAGKPNKILFYMPKTFHPEEEKEVETNEVLYWLQELKLEKYWPKWVDGYHHENKVEELIAMTQDRREKIKKNVKMTGGDFKKLNWGLRSMATRIKRICLRWKVDRRARKFELYHSNIRDKGCELIGPFLAISSSLEQLELAGNKITAKGATALAKGLKANTTLTNMVLWDNPIGDKGAEAIGEALKFNSTLRVITLWDNDIYDKGAIAIANGLARNHVLTKIDLSYNEIGDGGAIRIANAMRERESYQFELKLEQEEKKDKNFKCNLLDTVWIYENRISNEGIEALLSYQHYYNNSIHITVDHRTLLYGTEWESRQFDAQQIKKRELRKKKLEMLEREEKDFQVLWKRLKEKDYLGDNVDEKIELVRQAEIESKKQKNENEIIL